MNGRLHPVFARFMEHDEEYWINYTLFILEHHEEHEINYTLFIYFPFS